MVRTTTTEITQAEAYDRWFRAWSMLPNTYQHAIVAYCLRADRDVAEIALWL